MDTAWQADPRLRLSVSGAPASLQECIRAGQPGCRARSSTAVFVVPCKTHLFSQAVSQKCIRGENSLAMRFPRHFSCRKYCFCVSHTKVRGVGRRLLQQQTTPKFARTGMCTQKSKKGYKYYPEAHLFWNKPPFLKKHDKWERDVDIFITQLKVFT